MAANRNEDTGKQYSASTPDVSEQRNKILEEHTKKYPDGDPSVRRISPDKGTFGVGTKKDQKNSSRE